MFYHKSKLKQILNILKVTRLGKLVPLPLVIIMGSLATGEAIYLPAVAIACAFIFVVAVIGNQINILTDIELDKNSKPSLAKVLLYNRMVLRSVLLAEVLLSLTLLSLLFLIKKGLLGLVLLIATITSISYSYNLFIPWDGTKYRLKITWWGHPLTIISSYFCLYLAGYVSGSHNVIDFNVWIFVFLGISLSNYSVFLNESALDFREEKEHSLKSIAAIFNAKTKFLSFLLWILAVICTSVFLSHLPSHRKFIVSLAVIAGLLIDGCANIFALFPNKIKSNFIDTMFFFSRIVPIAVFLLYDI